MVGYPTCTQENLAYEKCPTPNWEIIRIIQGSLFFLEHLGISSTRRIWTTFKECLYLPTLISRYKLRNGDLYLWGKKPKKQKLVYLSPTPGVHPNSCLWSQWCHPAISSSVVPFSSCPQSPSSIRVFSNESTLRMRWPKYWSFSFSIIPSKEPRADLLQNGLVWSPCSPRDSQESSPTPQFKSINSSALSLLHSPTLTSIHPLVPSNLGKECFQRHFWL